MMGSYSLYIVCVVLYTMHSVHSLIIKGRIKHNNDAVSEVQVSNYVDGENWSNTRDLTLDRLEGAGTLPTLTVANFKVIDTLALRNIALKHIPVFVNTTINNMIITRNKIISVPANAFSEPRPSYLDLSSNGIHRMADKSINMGASKVLLPCNEISEFSQSWFEDPGNIVFLHLSSNLIEHIPDQAFSQMTKLDMLYLSYNHITSIGSEAFGSVITDMHLQFNNIGQLTPDMFVRRDIAMAFLLLHHNQLTYLPEALLLKLKPKHISLFDNPWQCQCFRDAENRLRELNSTRLDIPYRRGEPVCVTPQNFMNVCVPAVDTELQQTYARGQSPVQGCWATPCLCVAEKLAWALTMSVGGYQCGYAELRHDGAM